MKLAFITPRYGAEIAAGPEHACRLLAEQLCERHDVDVITTCARDESSWKNDYAEGADRVLGVLVRRFATTQGHDRPAFLQLSERLFTTPHSRAEELDWVRRLGPWSPGLIDFLKRQHRNYDALAFFSSRHATTVHGITVAPERAILFPWLQLDPAQRLSIIQETLAAPAAIGFCSGTERRLYTLHARGARPQEEIVGVGVEPPPQQTYPRLVQDVESPDPDQDSGPPLGRTAGQHWPIGSQSDPTFGSPVEETPVHLAGRGVPFRRRHRLHGRFVLYGGRVEPDNGCEELIEYFASYASRDGNTSLVLMGVKMMKVPDEPWLRMPGVLPDRERMIACEAAEVTLAPAAGDLLAQQALESFAVGTPVLASARNPAAVDHCRRASAGLYYGNREEFVEALQLMLSNDRLRASLGRSGLQYTRQNYRWEAVLGRFERLVTRLRRA
jgi:glycosyltransferase involved in cell wall biosynthesis